MDKAAVRAHFGTLQAIAEALGITKSAVSQWPDLVPELWAYKLHAITHGAIAFDPQRYARHEVA